MLHIIYISTINTISINIITVISIITNISIVTTKGPPELESGYGVQFAIVTWLF